MLALFAAALLVGQPTAAQPLTITAGLKFSPPTYRTHSWQPIHLEFLNRGDVAIEGSAVISLTHPQAPAAMVLPASVPPHARVRATIWAYFPPPSAATKTDKGDIPPLGVAEFRSRDGALLTRAEIVGLPVSNIFANAAADENQRGELILVVGRRELLRDEPYEATWLIHHVSDHIGLPMAVANVGLDRLPHEPAGLRSLKAIVLEAIDPESLSQAQRAALLDYLHSGGVVVVAAPVDKVGRGGNWFERHMPVRLVGSRMAAQIETSSDGGKPALKLREWLPIVEAVDAGGDVVLRGKDFVHVAAKSVGLGKVVFTSFPLNGLDEKQPQVAVLW